MKLYVIRHGQTECNVKNRYNCRLDEDINETGIEQALKAKENVKKLDINLIVCSPLKRTVHTMKIINDNNIPVIYDERLVEREGGVLTNTEVEPHFYKTEFYNYYSTNIPEGLEPLPEFFARVHSCIEEIKEKYKDKNILIVTHGGVAKAIQFYFEPIPKDGNLLKVGQQENCQIKEYEL